MQCMMVKSGYSAIPPQILLCLYVGDLLSMILLPSHFTGHSLESMFLSVFHDFSLPCSDYTQRNGAHWFSLNAFVLERNRRLSGASQQAGFKMGKHHQHPDYQMPGTKIVTQVTMLTQLLGWVLFYFIIHFRSKNPSMTNKIAIESFSFISR